MKFEDLRRTKENTYTPLPRPMMGRITETLKENNIPYRILHPIDAPEEVSDIAHINGHAFTRGIYILETTVEEEDVIKYVEDSLNREPEGLRFSV